MASVISATRLLKQMFCPSVLLGIVPHHITTRVKNEENYKENSIFVNKFYSNLITLKSDFLFTFYTHSQMKFLPPESSSSL
jgi:hypothetical protein